MTDGAAPSEHPALHERLLLAMNRAELTQAQLAQRLHTDPRVLRRYLKGERTPPAEVLALWERECDLPPGSLSSTAPHRPPAGEPSDPVPVPRRRLMGVGMTAGIVVAALVAAVVWFATTRDHKPAGRAAALTCPPAADNPTFFGTTSKDGVFVRDGAGQDFPVRLEIGPGACQLGFSGYCVGQPVVDVLTGTLDSRWYIISAHGRANKALVASGVIFGEPPNDSPPVSCAGSRTVPRHIELLPGIDAQGAGQPLLRAVSAGADIIGFAALLPSGGPDELPRWQQVGFDQGGPNGFSLQVKPLGNKVPFPTSGDVSIAAVVCLAGGAPTNIQAVIVLRSNGNAAPTFPGVPGPDPGPQGREAACRFPTLAP